MNYIGERPLPSCLGGGDLDGDLYNVTTRRDLLPRRTYKPASYDPVQKKLVDHESTMDDVADFVAEFISSDVSVHFKLAKVTSADLTSTYYFHRLSG